MQTGSGFGRRMGAGRAALLLTTMISAPGWAQSTPAPAAAPQEVGIEEIVVTAQKRSESLQKVPISVQAINGEQLKQLNITNADDYIKFLPSVSVQKSGPGFSPVYFRGVASGENNNHSGPLPSVGTYLDEQPITTIQGALDIHLYDIQRIEALAGPQGTLYGASSQAGTIKIITNKPELGVTKGAVDVGVNVVDHGGVGGTVEGFVNAPLGDKLAIRLVGWYQRDGGYIDNVAGSRVFPTSGATVNNNGLVKNNYNPVDTYGARAALKIELNDSWTVTPLVMAQEQKSKGGFAYDPTVGDLKIQRYFPESSKDRWLQAALTIEGKIGRFDLTYAGSYLTRKDETQSDYSDYSFSYDSCCGYGSYWVDNSGAPLANPGQRILGKDGYAKISQELRIASPKEDRLRFIGGIFYQRQRHNITQKYIIDGFADSLQIPNNSTPDLIWLTQQQRVDRDYAAFGEVSFDLTDKLTALGGFRVFHYNNSLAGFFGYSAGFSSGTGEAACFKAAVRPDSPCTNVDKATKDTDAIYKGNLTYKFDDEKLAYFTYSRGFRPGGVNRRGTLDPYASDFLDNFEIGWKTSWLDNRLRFNGAAYIEKWKGVQFSRVGANGLTEIGNAGNATIKGFEFDITGKLSQEFTVNVAASYNDATLDKNFCRSTDPTFTCTGLGTDGKPNRILAAKGTQLPTTPKFKGTARLRYTHEFSWGDGFAQLAGTYQDKTYADLRDDDRAVTGATPSRGNLDLSVGASKDGWRVQAYINNLTDNRGQIRRSTQCSTGVCTTVFVVPTQPRTFGLTLGRDF